MSTPRPSSASPIKREQTTVVHSSAVTPLIGRSDVKEMERDVTLRLGRLQSDLLTLKQHRGYLSVHEQKLVDTRVKAMQQHASQLTKTIAELEQLSFEFAPSCISAGSTAIPELQRHAFDLADRQVRACIIKVAISCMCVRARANV